MIIKILLYPFTLLRDVFVERAIKNTSEEKRFELIHKLGYWKPIFGGSISGAGSNFNATEKISTELPIFLKESNVKSMLDIPCGDLYWMSKIDLKEVQYIGGDIVSAIIQNNKKQYNNGKEFVELNIIEDQLLSVDLIFVRDCLVHLTRQQILDSIKNISKSGATYFASTTFPKEIENQEPINADRWRPLNLTLPPFSLPEPIKYLDDSCYNIPSDIDKKIGVWKVSDLEGVVRKF